MIADDIERPPRCERNAVDNSYPTPALCDALSWTDLRILVDRLYRDLDNHRTLVAALRADMAAVREARDGWPGDDVEYVVDPGRVEVVE